MRRTFASHRACARAKRGGRRRLLSAGVLGVLVAAVALAMSGCGLIGHSTSSPPPRVLGQPSGTPPVVGQAAPPGTGELDAVSCASELRCWAVGVSGPDDDPAGPANAAGVAVIVATTDGGESWKAQHVSGGTEPQLDGVSCPTPTTCLAVGSSAGVSSGTGEVVATHDAGTNWVPVTSPPDALVVTGVACLSARDCTAIVDAGTSTWSVGTTDAGHTWQQGGGLPASFQPGDDLTCSSAGVCLVAGYVPTTNGHGQGAVAISPDDGQQWSLAAVPTGTGVLRTAACASATVCLAAGTMSTTVSDLVAVHGSLLRSTDGGHTWVATATPPVDDVYGVACPSAQRCAMVGTRWVGLPAVGTGAVARSVNGGRAFRRAASAYTPLTLAGLACPTVDTCVAVGGSTLARITLGGAPAR